MKLLIIGHARHGKDTVAEIINNHYGLSFSSSSEAAARIFIFDKLSDIYGYGSFEECYDDRISHRKEWHDLICEYNKDDPARLAKEIMKENDIYVGMRSDRELRECLDIGLFDHILWVVDPRKPEEPSDSFNISFSEEMIPILNCGSLSTLKYHVLETIDRLNNNGKENNKDNNNKNRDRAR